ncbi:hypothetical protein C2I33_21880 [Ralstonia solanacearum]|nr:hypothetical protein KR96_08410 [Ralstonia solanacearum]TYZ52034.1 hypothetical protein C2I33_21880 [Ralstonia solanacearum]
MENRQNRRAALTDGFYERSDRLNSPLCRDAEDLQPASRFFTCDRGSGLPMDAESITPFRIGPLLA